MLTDTCKIPSVSTRPVFKSSPLSSTSAECITTPNSTVNILLRQYVYLWPLPDYNSGHTPSPSVARHTLLPRPSLNHRITATHNETRHCPSTAQHTLGLQATIKALLKPSSLSSRHEVLTQIHRYDWDHSRRATTSQETQNTTSGTLFFAQDRRFEIARTSQPPFACTWGVLHCTLLCNLHKVAKKTC